MSLARTFGSFAMCFVFAACTNGNETDSGVTFQMPQVFPDINPLCITTMHVEVGKSFNQPILVQNLGRDPLMISGAEMFEDERNHFSIQGPDVMSVPERGFAAFQLRYSPTETGWDAASVRISSNAENYPILDVYVVALAEPAGLDGGSFDPGPRPERARDSCQD
jgi:hypothetical protein